MLNNKKILSLFTVAILFLTICLSFSVVHVQASNVYNVGPGKTYLNIGDVPWENLQAGDVVNIYYRPVPYREKWVINVNATPSNPLIVRGIPDPATGALPIIDGKNATTRSSLVYGIQTRNIIKIGGSTVPSNDQPRNIIIENLKIINGNESNQFYDNTGQLQTYANNASGIYVEKGDNITIRNCEITGNGNGIFAASSDDWDCYVRNLLVEKSSIYSNGNVDRYYEHNIYAESVGAIYQYNYIGNVKPGSLGTSLKDRSSGTIVRYNWIDSGSRTLDLVDAQEGYPVIGSQPDYHDAFVYGNVMYTDEDGASNMIHWGGDSGIPSHNRNGTLYFYNNTVIIERDQAVKWSTTLFDPTDANNTIDARNNIIFCKSKTPGSTPTELRLLREPGTTANFGINWVSPDWVAGGGTPYGTSNFISPSDNDPGFVSITSRNYHIISSSDAINVGMSLHSAASNYPVNKEYVYHQSYIPRSVYGSSMDLGAHEYTGSLNPTPTSLPTNTPSPSPTPTPPVGGDSLMQAENYSSQSECSVGTSHDGYAGSGYLDFGGNGSYGEWNNINVPSSGTYTLIFRYANGSPSNRQCNIRVNGASVGNISFSPTTYWTSWQEASITVGLNSGNNIIRVTANTSSGGPNLDLLEAASEASTPSPTPTPTPSSSSLPINIFSDTQNFIFGSTGAGSAEFNSTEGVNGTPCVKYTVNAWQSTYAMNYSENPINISAVTSTDVLKLHVDVGTSDVGYLMVYINNWQNSIIFNIDNVTGYQVVNLDLSSVLSGLNGEITQLYFKSSDACTMWVDEIAIIDP